MNTVVPIQRQEPLDLCDHHDRWLAAFGVFKAQPCHDAKETMLQRYAAFYRSLCSGSSVGLEEVLDKMELGADQMIAAEEARNRSSG